MNLSREHQVLLSHLNITQWVQREPVITDKKENLTNPVQFNHADYQIEVKDDLKPVSVLFISQSGRKPGSSFFDDFLVACGQCDNTFATLTILQTELIQQICQWKQTHQWQQLVQELNLDHESIQFILLLDDSIDSFETIKLPLQKLICCPDGQLEKADGKRQLWNLMNS